MHRPNIYMLQTVAEGLGTQLAEVVFVGGTTAGLYATDPASPPHRGTDDVDCVVEVTSYREYAQLQEQLYQLGFQPAAEPGAPICRLTYRSLVVDVMPTIPHILGFSNRWYPEGMANTLPYVLPNGLPIRLFRPAYFVASKLEAFRHRGNGEYRWSQDFDDLVYVLDSRPEIVAEIRQAAEVRTYI
jgi:predicted nucleotidyltransferase